MDKIKFKGVCIYNKIKYVIRARGLCPVSERRCIYIELMFIYRQDTLC